MTVASLGCLGVLVVATHARVASLERECKALRQKLEARRAQNAFLQVALDGLRAPEKLAREAARMGMRTPDREAEVVLQPPLPAPQTTADARPERVALSAAGSRRRAMTTTALRVAAFAQAVKGTPLHASPLGR